MDFKHYYAALLRHGGQVEPRADEALKDFRAMLIRIHAGGMF